ncbi:hypothetical protein BJ138DRAFT_1153517 [Hygrophoropsis aurantiaca]|uniref:Uncharacterized protein n=1 Tax=Hygrophoropsis aurantiaca TaxID=72124 RepID=A0ACB8A9M8_9AGAM|nr:hypothetical protein BJ138DRAFT_1153517 [Hygrophoropsis aurantiaca]
MAKVVHDEQKLTDVSSTAVSFHPSSHLATPFEEEVRSMKPINEDPATAVLRKSCPEQFSKCAEVLQSSFPTSPGYDLNSILPQNHGFVHTVLEAYNRHRALVIRPDDVWLSILVQFSFFVNGNAELLRKNFVAHEGKKEPVVQAMGGRYSVDFGEMSRQMTEQLHQNVVDPALREWVLPSFSTTTITDTTVYAMVMMATLKEYFSYKMCLMCGIPSVTLDGKKEDWEAILERLDKLADYGSEAHAWSRMLRPLIVRFVRAFEDPDSEENRDFWGKVAHYEGGGSGPTYLSGWLTAFCVFDAKGKWQGPPITETTDKTPPTDTVPVLISSFDPPPSTILDGVSYPVIDTNDIPNGYAKVDVKLDDNGQEFDTVIVAGSIGSQICSSGKSSVSSTGIRDTVRPLPGWWMFVKK